MEKEPQVVCHHALCMVYTKYSSYRGRIQCLYVTWRLKGLTLERAERSEVATKDLERALEDSATKRGVERRQKRTTVHLRKPFVLAISEAYFSCILSRSASRLPEA